MKSKVATSPVRDKCPFSAKTEDLMSICGFDSGSQRDENSLRLEVAGSREDSLETNQTQNEMAPENCRSGGNECLQMHGGGGKKERKNARPVEHCVLEHYTKK